MARNGIKTGGRKKGTPNKRTRELLDLNYCPVEELLKLLKNKNLSIDKQIFIHKTLLPYFYPHRKAVEFQEEIEEPRIVFIKGVDINKI